MTDFKQTEAADLSGRADISGYRQLSPEEVQAINQIKGVGVAVENLLVDIHSNPDLAVDMRWASIAKAELQKGFMFLVRAVEQPEGF